MVAPPAKDKAWFPHSLVVIRVRPGEAAVPADRTLVSAMNFGAMMAVLSHNKEVPGRLRLETLMQDKVEVKYLVNDAQFPPGLRPAFALKDGFLVLASSPEAIRRFSTKTTATPALSPDAEVPLLRLSLRQVSAYLKERREALIPFVAEKNQLSKVEVGQRLDSLLMGLELFDRLELSQQAAPGRATLKLRVQMIQALK